MAIAGPSGSGKTYTALAVGTALGKTAVVDTEHGSASKYADLFDFDVCELGEPYHPQRFLEAIVAAATGGYDVVIVDSLSHAWSGKGGMLNIVDDIGKRNRGGTFQAWREAGKFHSALVDGIIAAKCHVIATMRTKQEYVVEKNDRGKSAPRKVGTAPVQRDGMEYEFDVFAEMNQENDLIIQKSRCPVLTNAVLPRPGKDLAETLKAWLADGVAPEPTSTKVTPAHEDQLDALRSLANNPAAPANMVEGIRDALKSPLTYAKAKALISRSMTVIKQNTTGDAL